MAHMALLICLHGQPGALQAGTCTAIDQYRICTIKRSSCAAVVRAVSMRKGDASDSAKRFVQAACASAVCCMMRILREPRMNWSGST